MMDSSLERSLLRLKYVVSLVLWCSGANCLIKKFLWHLHGNLPVVVVLCYHSVTAEQVDNFESQLDYLRKNDFTFISGKELLDLMAQPKKFEGHRRYVCLTFDDCYENSYSVVRPVLEERKLPAICFAVSSKLGQFADWENSGANSGRLMTKEQLKEMALSFEIGAHTEHHIRLGNAPYEIALNEVRNSQKELTELLGRKVRFFAYPNGSYNSATSELVSKLEFGAAFAIDQHSNYSYDEKYALGRYLVNPENLVDFRLKAMGGYDWFFFLKRLFLAKTSEYRKPARLAE